MFTMETVAKKKPRHGCSFTPEFKADIVERCQAGDRTVGQVARDFDPTETAMRRWVNQAELDLGAREGQSSDDRKELSRPRRESRQLRDDVGILKRATAFLAQETR
jgi:transposase